MVPHSRRGRAWRNLFKTSGRAPVHFLQPPSLGFVPLSTSILPLASPGDSSSQSLASRRQGAQLNPQHSTPRRGERFIPNTRASAPLLMLLWWGFLVSFLRRPVRGGGSLMRGIAGSGQGEHFPSCSSPARTHWSPAAPPVYPNRCHISRDENGRKR